MIPMACPSCGRRGTIPPDKLFSRMHCKKCDAVFYMDPSGRIMLGEPPDPNSKKPARKARPAERNDTPSLGETIRELPTAAKVGFPAFLALLLGYMFIWPMISGSFANTPTERLNRQSAAFVRAAIGHDEAGVKGLATADGAGDALKAAEAIRAAFAKAIPGGDPKAAIISAVVYNLDEKARKAQTIATVFPPNGGSPGAGNLPVTLSWSADEAGKWSLDAPATAAAAPKP